MRVLMLLSSVLARTDTVVPRGTTSPTDVAETLDSDRGATVGVLMLGSAAPTSQ